jgi:hypothetical protein
MSARFTDVKSYYILWYQINRENNYLIWFTGDKDGVYSENGKVPTFASKELLRQFAESKNIELVNEEPILHNFDSVNDWLCDATKVINPHDFLVVWNSVGDIAETLKLQFSGDNRDSAVYQIYGKLFAANNLPAMNAEYYELELDEKETSLLGKIMRDCLRIFRESTKISDFIKNQLFNLELFNPDFAVFPKQVFKEKFDEYLFMNLEDWFNNENDFNCLHFFLEAINEPYLYCAVPAHHNLSDLKIDHNKGCQHFIDEYTFAGKPNEIGLRISPTGFWYGESLDWAIVSDLTNNIFIVGLKNHAALNFKADFSGQHFDIHEVVKRTEEANFILGKNENPDFEYSEMLNKMEILQRYSGSSK